jgi:hypothetical protein
VNSPEQTKAILNAHKADLEQAEAAVLHWKKRVTDLRAAVTRLQKQPKKAK